MEEALLLALKWASFGNAIFMLLWIGLWPDRPLAWVVLDTLIVIASLWIAERYHASGV